MNKFNYYQILDIKYNCNLEDIKKAYKEKARIYHPDKASSEKKDEYQEIFKNINNAYSVLKDKESRLTYDLNNGFKNNNFFNQNNFFSDDIFNNNFYNYKFKKKLDNTYINLEISLKEVYYGSEKIINYHIYDNSSKILKKIKIKIKSGIENGFLIIKNGLGNKKNGYISGNLIVKISYLNDINYKIIDANNIMYIKNINICTALTGTIFTLEHFSGKKINISVDNIFKKNIFKIPYLGLPNNNNIFGNLIIKFNIDYDYILTEEQKIQIRNILPNEKLNYDTKIDSFIRIE
jgi:DnaJ-class molecular chaperone